MGSDTGETTAVNVDVFQAAQGDLDGNQIVNIADIFEIKGSPRGFGTGATDATWTDGDIVGMGLGTPANGIVNIWDIFAIKSAGHFGAGSYAAGDEAGYNAVPEPGSLAMLALGLFGLLAWKRRQKL